MKANSGPSRSSVSAIRRTPVSTIRRTPVAATGTRCGRQPRTAISPAATTSGSRIRLAGAGGAIRLRSQVGRLLLVFLLAATCTATSVAQDVREAAAPTSIRYAAAIDTSRALISDLMNRTGIPAITLAVGMDGRLVWSEGFGYADVENRVAAWPDTKMRVGSVAKSMTAAAIGILVEQGHLDLDAPVQTYVPYFPEKPHPITSRQVAGHLAGIRHYRGGEYLLRDHFETVREGLGIFADDSLLHAPGSKYAYSSYGFNLLSAVVEGAAESEFLPYMRESVFWPLEMHDTVADHPDSLIMRRPRYYEVTDDGTLMNSPYVDNSYKWAGGGYLSTAPDLVRFGLGLLGNRLFSEETREMLFAPQATDDGESTGYGIGFSTNRDDAGRRVVGHGGGSVGGTTGFVMYPDEGLVFAIIANVSSADLGGVHERIIEAFLDGAGE